MIVFQLTHSGEISEPEFSRRVCVKPVYGLEGDILTEEEVDHIMDSCPAAKICRNVGADGVDMKLCHGYLGSRLSAPIMTGTGNTGALGRGVPHLLMI